MMWSPGMSPRWVHPTFSAFGEEALKTIMFSALNLFMGNLAQKKTGGVSDSLTQLSS